MKYKKIKQDIINKSNQKENNKKSRIPYEYKVGDQVLLETPGILRKLSTPRTRPYPVRNVYKNGSIRKVCAVPPVTEVTCLVNVTMIHLFESFYIPV
jgi:hypothetical protein